MRFFVSSRKRTWTWPKSCCENSPASPSKRTRGRIVQQQHHVCEQAVAAGEIDDAAAAKQTPDPSRCFPRFEQLFARKASGVADRPRQAVEQADHLVAETVEGL